MVKFKHKYLGRIAKETNQFYEIENMVSYIPKELIEDNDDRERIEEDKLFLNNGMFTGENPYKYDGLRICRTKVCFDEDENMEKRKKKMEAYKKIMARIDKMNGDREPDWDKEDQDKFQLVLSVPNGHFWYNENNKVNDFVCRDNLEIPENIKEAVRVYFTS